MRIDGTIGAKNIPCPPILSDAVGSYSGAVIRGGWRYVVDARCRDGRRFVIESDEILTASLELEAMLL